MKKGKRIWYDGVLSIPEGKSGDWEIAHTHYPAGKKMTTGSMRTAYYGQKSTEIIFEQPTRWHKLLENGGTWMSDLPVEQRQADELIVGAYGRVLVGGLGLGYHTTALLKKPAVKEVVVVEISQDVINLVWQPTLDNLRTKKKVEIVNADLFDYLKLFPIEKQFNWGVYDIWQSDGETTFHTTVVPLRKLSRGKVMHVRCWNEDIMRGQLAAAIETRLLGFQIAPSMTPTVDQLATPGDPDDYWRNWSVPFWQWYRDKGPHDQKVVRDMISTYVMLYGRGTGLENSIFGVAGNVST